jgi:protein AFG1
MRLQLLSVRTRLRQPHLRRSSLRSLQQQRVRCLSSSGPGPGPITSKLQELVSKGEIKADDHQLRTAKELDRLHHDLMKYDPPPLNNKSASEASSSSSSSLFADLFGSNSSASSWAVSKLTTSRAPAIRGAYVYGGVGCGKTFLMNLLYESIDSGPWSTDKQKVHYHKFMLTVHQHMHEQRKIAPKADLIPPVVDQLLKQGRFLCLDEFQVTDVADALILQRLFQELWKAGCVLVATSNRPPQDLYLHGLQRDRFLPFIDLMEEKCAVVNLLESSTDYRRMTTFCDGQQPVYFASSSGKGGGKKAGRQQSSKEFYKLFHQLTNGHATNPTALETQGRKVPVPLACPSQQVACFAFEDLCQKALGAADYLVIGHHFSTVFCHSIPKLTIHHVNWLRRFITFVDTMYEMNVTLILQTHAESLDDIFVLGDNKDDYSQDEVFAFDRTRSRLEEMKSPKYLSSPWLGGGSKEKVTTRLTMQPSVSNNMADTTIGENEDVVAQQHR